MFVFFPYKLQLGDECLLEIENRLTCKANVGLNILYSFALLPPRGSRMECKGPEYWHLIVINVLPGSAFAQAGGPGEITGPLTLVVPFLEWGNAPACFTEAQPDGGRECLAPGLRHADCILAVAGLLFPVALRTLCPSRSFALVCCTPI